MMSNHGEECDGNHEGECFVVQAHRVSYEEDKNAMHWEFEIGPTIRVTVRGDLGHPDFDEGMAMVLTQFGDLMHRAMMSEMAMKAASALVDKIFGPKRAEPGVN